MTGSSDTTTVTLTASSGEVTHATGRLQILSPGARALRAGLTLLVAVGLAALIIPVPIVHLVGIPLVLGAGVAASVRQYRGVARLAPMSMPCPKCGERNSLGGGFGYRSATEPLSRSCESCRRGLELRFTSGP